MTGSWTGGVILGDHFYGVFLNGPRATEAQIVAWLQVAKTRKGQGSRRSRPLPRPFAMQHNACIERYARHGN